MNSIELLSLLLNIMTLLVVLDTRSKLPAKKRREFELVEKRYTNLGGSVVPLPAVDAELEARMKAYYLHGEQKFTEKFIMKTFGATQVQAINIKAKWERDSILKRENMSAANSPHVLASYGKLRKL